MESNNFKFCFIFNEDGIRIEVQEQRDRLSPFIRAKSKLVNLEYRISNAERNIFLFLKMFGKESPPFFLDKKDLHIDILKNIEKSNFMFLENKSKSLKRIFSIPSDILQACKKDVFVIEPKKIAIRIERILPLNIVQTDFFFEFSEVNYTIPIDYTFLIPTMDDQFFRIEPNAIKNYNCYFKEIVGKEILRHEKYRIDDLYKVNKDSRFYLFYKSKNIQKKCTFFEQKSKNNTNFFIYDDHIDRKTLYHSILKNYLENKNFIELDDNIIFFGDKEVQHKVFVQNFIDTLSDEDILLFFKKIYTRHEDIYLENVDNLFKFNLKKHQLKTLVWLYSLYKNNITGALLADEMGLGKTIQAISFFEYIGMKKILIVSPASLVENWKKEILSFLYVSEEIIKTDFCDNARIVIVSYEKLRLRASIEQTYDILILDETQKIKNNQTLAYKSIARVKRHFTLAITGTPIENSINDLWNILSTINNNIYSFCIDYIQPYVNQENIEKAVELTTKFFSPIIMQRKKEEVLRLPEMKLQTVKIKMSDTEYKEYKKIVNIFASALKTREFARINSIALEGLLRIRQFCSIHNILPKTLLSYQLDDTKLKQCLILIKEIIEKKERVVLFSQFTKTLDILERYLGEYSFVRLDGTMSPKTRKQNIELFQKKNSSIQVFLISLKAGGVGLTLTNAQNAILFEPWFNPAIESQAFSRIHRIGQEKITNIYRLVYTDTVEEQMDHILFDKSKMASKFSETLKIKSDANFALRYFLDKAH